MTAVAVPPGVRRVIWPVTPAGQASVGVVIVGVAYGGATGGTGAATGGVGGAGAAGAAGDATQSRP